jgi:hypothetical protein
MLIAPPFGLLAHGRAVSKDCPHSQTSLFYSIHNKKSRCFFTKTNDFFVFFDILSLFGPLQGGEK